MSPERLARDCSITTPDKKQQKNKKCREGGMVSQKNTYKAKSLYCESKLLLPTQSPQTQEIQPSQTYSISKYLQYDILNILNIYNSKPTVQT
jgi:hypothetical protein